MIGSLVKSLAFHQTQKIHLDIDASSFNKSVNVDLTVEEIYLES